MPSNAISVINQVSFRSPSLAGLYHPEHIVQMRPEWVRVRCWNYPLPSTLTSGNQWWRALMALAAWCHPTTLIKPHHSITAFPRLSDARPLSHAFPPCSGRRAQHDGLPGNEFHSEAKSHSLAFSRSRSNDIVHSEQQLDQVSIAAMQHVFRLRTHLRRFRRR